MSVKQQRRILVAPLDWGLGHTSRCVPIIREIQAQQHVPVFAGNELQRKFIENSVGPIENIHLDGYNVSWYGSIFLFLPALPNILSSIKIEHRWLKRIAIENKIDGIISDNRYGLWHDHIPSVCITHQVNPISGMGYFVDRFANSLLKNWLNHFSEIWIPDIEKGGGVAGKLSHVSNQWSEATYIGLLSQFCGIESKMEGDPKSLLVLLSGPEPQRSMLSHKLKEQLRDHTGPLIFVDGKLGADKGCLPAHASYFAMATSQQLLRLIEAANLVICRSGYSTIMDLLLLGKKAILIPTPGQTEQLYLAKCLNSNGRFLTGSQQNLDLKELLISSTRLEQPEKMEFSNFICFADTLSKWIGRL